MGVRRVSPDQQRVRCDLDVKVFGLNAGHSRLNDETAVLLTHLDRRLPDRLPLGGQPIIECSTECGSTITEDLVCPLCNPCLDLVELVDQPLRSSSFQRCEPHRRLPFTQSTNRSACSWCPGCLPTLVRGVARASLLARRSFSAGRSPWAHRTQCK